jgi:hypothetical protein
MLSRNDIRAIVAVTRIVRSTNSRSDPRHSVAIRVHVCENVIEITNLKYIFREYNRRFPLRRLFFSPYHYYCHHYAEATRNFTGKKSGKWVMFVLPPEHMSGAFDTRGSGRNNG